MYVDFSISVFYVGLLVFHMDFVIGDKYIV